MMALYQEQEEEEAQGITQGHEGMENLFPSTQSTHSPCESQCGQSLLVQTHDLVQDAKVSMPVTMDVQGINTSTVTTGAGIAHEHLSNFKKGLFNVISSPFLKFASQKTLY